jgi:hypothetical protein
LTPSESRFTKSEAKRKGLIYDLVGLGLFSEASSHFIARYADKESAQIYTYDSMKNNGNAISSLDPEPDTGDLVTHIASGDIPPTYTPSLAIYHLRGGADAQQAFYQTQTKACNKLFNLQFSTPELSTLPDVTYCGLECPILLDPGPRQKQKGLKEYISKKRSVSEHWPGQPESGKSPTAAPDNNSLSSEAASPPPIVDGPEEEEETIPLHPRGKRLGALKINTETENTHRVSYPTASAPDLPPSPDSPFNIKCRCGLKGDGNVFFDEKEGLAVLCTECEHWSHIACQRNGRASKLRPKEAFFCDICQGHAPGMGKSEKDRAAERKCVFINPCSAVFAHFPS